MRRVFVLHSVVPDTTLLYHPKILLVDEALSGLDTTSALAIHHLILAFPATVIEIEHQVDARFLRDYDQVLKISGQQISAQASDPSQTNN
ncbi:MAG: hypothetical protein ABF913_03870 [Oenococcus sp.]|uniref:hypothetical protein n=1 Tax=Oenococcus sp. TaxID=1979414 RepID=UPI0039EB7434